MSGSNNIVSDDNSNENNNIDISSNNIINIDNNNNDINNNIDNNNIRINYQ